MVHLYETGAWNHTVSYRLTIRSLFDSLLIGQEQG